MIEMGDEMSDVYSHRMSQSGESGLLAGKTG
jgi:hypothetical protein